MRGKSGRIQEVLRGGVHYEAVRRPVKGTRHQIFRANPGQPNYSGGVGVLHLLHDSPEVPLQLQKPLLQLHDLQVSGQELPTDSAVRDFALEQLQPTRLRDHLPLAQVYADYAKPAEGLSLGVPQLKHHFPADGFLDEFVRNSLEVLPSGKPDDQNPVDSEENSEWHLQRDLSELKEVQLAALGRSEGFRGNLRVFVPTETQLREDHRLPPAHRGTRQDFKRAIEAHSHQTPRHVSSGTD